MNHLTCTVRTIWMLALLTAVVLPSTAKGQVPGTQRSYPAELIDALYGLEAGDIVVGALPETGGEDFPLLPDLRIVGSRKGDSLISVIAESSRAIDEVTREYLALLAEQGWTHKQQEGPDHGFVAPEVRRYDWYCNPADEYFKPTIEQADSGATRLWLYRSPGPSQQCQEMPRRHQPRDLLRDIPFPRLEAPAGSRMRITSSGYHENSVESSAALIGDVSGQAALSHFGQQITAAGWESRGQCRQDLVHFESFIRYGESAPGDDEQTWIGMLSVLDSSSGSGPVHVSFRVIREGADEL